MKSLRTAACDTGMWILEGKRSRNIALVLSYSGLLPSKVTTLLTALLCW